MLLLNTIKKSFDQNEILRKKQISFLSLFRNVAFCLLMLVLMIFILTGLFSLALSLMTLSGASLDCWFPAWLPIPVLGGKDWFEISIALLSLVAVASIPIVLEISRKSEARQSEIARLANTLSDRFFYVEVLAVSWEITSKWISWRGIPGDSYRVSVAGGMIVFKQVPFDDEQGAQSVPFQNRIRFQDHNQPLSGFSQAENGADFNRPNEHMILTVWLNYWKEVERDIFHQRISESDAYERLSHLYSWFHDFHQQLWMVEFILKCGNFQTSNSLENLKEIASLEARFRRRAKLAGARVTFSVTEANWEGAYKVASDLLEQEQNTD